MKPFSDEPIKASTPGLDAMAARQNEPIKASTPGLDAMAARQSAPFDPSAKRRSEEEAQSRRAAENKEKAQQNRDARKLQRGLKRAEITGRVNQFVRDWANQNAAVTRAVNARGQSLNVVDLPNIGTLDVDTGKLVEGPLFKEPTSAIKVDKPGMPSGENVGDLLYWDGSEWTILPPPTTSALRVLATNGGAPFWAQTTDC